MHSLYVYTHTQLLRATRRRSTPARTKRASVEWARTTALTIRRARVRMPQGFKATAHHLKALVSTSSKQLDLVSS